MSKCATYVIRFPEDSAARERIVQGIRELVEKNAGDITAVSNEDEMTVEEVCLNPAWVCSNSQ